MADDSKSFLKLVPGNSLLFTAGPVNVPEEIRDELSASMISHRSGAFIHVYESVVESLRVLLGTDGYIIPISASGTGGMEAALINCLAPGDRVLVMEQGKFSSRWVTMSHTLGLDVTGGVHLTDHDSLHKDVIVRKLKHDNNIKAVIIVHCETSTGAINDIQNIASAVHENSNAILIVDAISTFATVPIKMDEWGIDVVVFTSNKGLMNPPGVAFIGVNKRTFDLARKNKRSYYFDFENTINAYRNGIGSPFTPSIPVFRGVNRAINLINDTGYELFLAQHGKIAHAFRQCIKHTGLKIWPYIPSDSVTVIEMPSFIRGAEFVEEMERATGILLSKGQGSLLDKVVRIGHFGIINIEDYKDLLSSFISILKRYGINTNRDEVLKILEENYIF